MVGWQFRELLGSAPTGCCWSRPGTPLAWLHAQRLDAAALVAGEATVDSSGTYEIGTEEVRLALTMTRREADAVVDLARALHARLPETRATSAR